MTHLHIAFAASGTTLSIVVRDGSGAELGRQSDTCDGAHAEWKAALFAVQYATAHAAQRLTLYSHHDAVVTALELKPRDHSSEYRRWSKGKATGSDLTTPEEDGLVWRYALMAALYGGFMGRWNVRRITAERNVALAGARAQLSMEDA